MKHEAHYSVCLREGEQPTVTTTEAIAVPKDVLVVGAESTCTRYLSTLVAINLGLIDSETAWDAVDKIEKHGTSVTHRSLPHGSRDNFVDLDYCKNFDLVLITTRDQFCSLAGEARIHQNDIAKAQEEQDRAFAVLAEIVEHCGRVHIWNYEAASQLGETYHRQFFRRAGLPFRRHVEVNEINGKYFRGTT